MLSKLCPQPLIEGDKHQGRNGFAYEVGVRSPLGKEVTIDAVAFYNDYSHVLSASTRAPRPEVFDGTEYTAVPLVFDDESEGECYGSELLLDWRPTPIIDFTATYGYIGLNFSRPDGLGVDPFVDTLQDLSPTNQASFRARLNLPSDVQLDTVLYYVDSLPAQQVASYLRTDVRLGWNPSTAWEAELVAQNLFDDTHREYAVLRNVEIERSVFARVTYRFE